MVQTAKKGNPNQLDAPGTEENPYVAFYVPEERRATSASVRAFLRDWRTYFQKARDGYKDNDKKAEHFWEGVPAYAELKKQGFSSSLLKPSLKKDSEFKWMFRMLTREVDLYSHWQNPDKINKAFATANSELPKIQQKLTKLFENAPLGILKSLPNLVEQRADSIRRAVARYWPDTLAYTQRERREALQHPRTHARIYLPPAESLQVDVLLSMLKSLPHPFTRKNLDTRFQVRTAGILWIYLPNISYQTISRLVALTYICGNLVKMGKTMTITLSKRELDVRVIRKTLTKYRVDKLDRPLFERELDRFFDREEPS